MLKKILFPLLIALCLHAETERFQIVSNDLVTKGDIVIATGDVVAFSPTYYITAKKAIYDKKKGTFELFDDVIVLKNNNLQMKSNYAFLDLNSNDMYQKPSIYFEDTNSIWISSKDSKREGDIVHLKDSVFSSCDCVDPDWTIKFSSADYDTKDMWLNTYNPRVYFKDVPLFYLPYMGFSTDTRRRSGLLFPSIGYSSKDGAYYAQPIYIAPAQNYDIELIPQIRTSRGSGLYAYLRYADSPNSMLKFSTGFFQEKSAYRNENDLRNGNHSGFDLDYERTKIFSPNRLGYSDGIYANINYLTDNEYRNLKFDNRDNDDDENEKVESKINYVYNTPSYYFGSYFRYYIDITQDTNKHTMQELPKLQAHSYTKPLFFDKLLYSADVKYTNHTRRDGITANQYELNLPISYSHSFFNDFLNVTLKHELIVNRYDYSESLNSFDNGTYAQSKTTLSLNSDLVKAYDNYVHTINIFANLNKVEDIEKDGYLYDITTEDSELQPFTTERAENNLEFGINQSFYDRNDLKEIVNHKLKAVMVYDDFNDMETSYLENEIIYNYFLGSISNRFIYDYRSRKLVQSSSYFTLNYNNFYLYLGHYYSKNTPNLGRDNSESYQARLKYKFTNNYSMEYYTNYNILDSMRTKQGLKFRISENCWDLDIKLEKDVEAVSSYSKTSRSQNAILFQLYLKPIGGISQRYTYSDDDNNNE